MQHHRFHFIYSFVAVFSLLLITSCAHVVSPDGGAKDITPPKLVSAIPKNQATYFTAKRIILKFDEFIQLKNQTDGVIISPPLNKEPKIKVSCKSIILMLNDTLQKNTTYTVNFGDGIADITENNPVSNFSYVFSTGSYIDSLNLNGTVLEAVTANPLKDMLVMLYKNEKDSIPSLKRPFYFTKTNEKGEWEIKHIKDGKYKIFALKDENANMLFDLPNELTAYCDTLINVGEKNKAIQLRAFKNKADKQQFLQAKAVEAGHVVLSFALPLDTDVVIIPYRKHEDWVKLIYKNATRDSVHIFYTKQANDSVYISVLSKKFKDSIGVEITPDKDSTLWQKKFSLSFKTNLNTSEASGRMGKPDSKIAATVSVIKPNNNVALFFNHPIRNLKPTTIKITIDSLKIKEYIFDEVNFYKINNTAVGYIFDKKLFDGGNKFSINAPKGIFTDCYGYVSDSISFRVEKIKAEELGNVNLKFTASSNKNYILQFTNKDGGIVFQTALKTSPLVMKNLLPGVYKIKVITDANGNGKWDSGNYYQHIQPEQVYMYPNDITVKTNWEVELEMKVE